MHIMVITVSVMAVLHVLSVIYNLLSHEFKWLIPLHSEYNDLPILAEKNETDAWISWEY